MATRLPSARTKVALRGSVVSMPTAIARTYHHFFDASSGWPAFNMPITETFWALYSRRARKLRLFNEAAVSQVCARSNSASRVGQSGDRYMPGPNGKVMLPV